MQQICVAYRPEGGTQVSNQGCCSARAATVFWSCTDILAALQHCDHPSLPTAYMADLGLLTSVIKLAAAAAFWHILRLPSTYMLDSISLALACCNTCQSGDPAPVVSHCLPQVVVMTQRSKLEMESMFWRSLPRSKRFGTQIIFRQGSVLVPTDLQMVGASRAAATVIVSDQSRSAAEADAQSVRYVSSRCSSSWSLVDVLKSAERLSASHSIITAAV